MCADLEDSCKKIERTFGGPIDDDYLEISDSQERQSLNEALQTIVKEVVLEAPDLDPTLEEEVRQQALQIKKARGSMLGGWHPLCHGCPTFFVMMI